MIKKNLAMLSFVLILCLSLSLFVSCGGNKDTTHDAGNDGQVVTENKNNANDKKDGMTDKNDNGVIGEAVTDVARGARDIIGGVANGARDIVGGNNGMNDNNVNGNDINGNGMNGSSMARQTPIPGGK